MKSSSAASDCLWMAVDVRFDENAIRGRDAPELWRAVIKDGLLATRADQAMLLLEPMRAQGETSNVDCPGLVVECRDMAQGLARVYLKFLGEAYCFAPACLLALEAGLRHGVGQQLLQGTVSNLYVWHGNDWVDVPVPLSATELQRWRAGPAVLSGYAGNFAGQSQRRHLTLQSRSRWVLRQKGKWALQAPELIDVLRLIQQRAQRFDVAWGAGNLSTNDGSLQLAIEHASYFELIGQDWRQVQRKVGGRYQSHGCHGHLRYEGLITEELMYWLYVGSFLHIGQQTAIGLGGYDLILE